MKNPIIHIAIPGPIWYTVLCLLTNCEGVSDVKKKLSLASQIFIALVLAIIAGILLGSHAGFAKTYIKPFGTIFLNLIKFCVVPLVLFSIMSGILSMNDVKKVGSAGLKTVVY